MSRVALSAFLAAAAASVVSAQNTAFPATPLVDKHYAYPSGLPYQADTDPQLIRGPQQGYNQCNSTTEGPNSLCQTAFINHIDDWCIWAPQKPNSTIADTEGEEVAWCTKPGRGTRLIPEGAIKGVQFLRAPSYLMVLAFLDQTLVNMAIDDFGGELDPNGADLRGNPIGGLIYSNGLPMSVTGDNNTFVQVDQWNNFIGGNFSCFKVCDPKDPLANDYCYNRLDRIGVSYNCPNAAQSGVYEICDSDNIVPPGQYVSDGVTVTYSQPAESLGPITSVPYTPTPAASSNCVTFQSTDLFAGLPTPTVAPAGGASSASAGASAGASGSSPAGASPAPGSKGASAGAASTARSSGSPSPTGGSSQTNGGAAVRTSVFATLAGVVFSVAFFA